jgi:predicted RNase H-like HicB family nuclease
MKYRIFLVPQLEGGYYVAIPALIGCQTQGENREHAIEMAKEAIQLFTEGIKDPGVEVLPDSSMEETIINWNGKEFRSFIVPRLNSGFTIEIPTLPGCGKYGRTKEQALENTNKELKKCLDEIEEDGDPIPEDSKTEEVIVEV